MKRISKKWLIVIGAVLLLLILWGIFRETPVPVEAGIVRKGEMVVSIDGEGKTRVRDKYTVTAPVSGLLSRTKLKEGDRIARDFVLTTIDPNPPERPVRPSQEGNVPSVYGVKIYAPASGRVLRVIEKDERFVQAGTPIMEIGNPKTLEIVVDVLSSEATRIRFGNEILIENWGGSKVLKGRVKKVEPQARTKISALGVEEQRVDVIANLTGGQSANLGDNFRLDVRIVVWKADNVLKVPSSSLFRKSGKWYVFAIEGWRARLREIRIGHQNPSEAEVLEGLQKNAKVILHPANTLEDGALVSEQ